MLMLDESIYVLGIWFVPHDPSAEGADRVDWLATIWRAASGGPWQGLARFRRHTGGPGAAAADHKTWYRFAFEAERAAAEVAALLHQAAAGIAERHHVTVAWVPVEESGVVAARRLAEQSWAHLFPQDLDAAPPPC